MTRKHRNRIIIGDALDELKKIGDNYFDLIIADPPFNKGKNYIGGICDNFPEEEYYEYHEKIIRHCFRILKPTGCIYWYINSYHLGKFQTIMQKYGVWQNTIVWHYTNPTPDKKRYPKTWSAFLFFSKTNNFYFNSELKLGKSFCTNLNFIKDDKIRLYDLWWDISKLVSGFLAQKECIFDGDKRACLYQLPEELIKRIILTSSKDDGTILDLFSHSGTTSYCAKLLERNWMAIEISEYYGRLIKNRLYGEM